MRGKDGRRQKRKPRVGITPAYAGKSLRGFAKVMALSDHPRICGEKRSGRRYHKLSLGSPPHMRGKVTKKLYGNDQKRDHPRICGEKLFFMQKLLSCRGSPPHMRGKVPLCRADCLCPGITPAYAGKSLLVRRFRGTYRDHPRICGEKYNKEEQKIQEKGSPPHMRGKEGQLSSISRFLGITPAYAGKSATWSSWRKPLWDHPRICGEKTACYPGKVQYEGSPPHMRGKVSESCSW